MKQFSKTDKRLIGKWVKAGKSQKAIASALHVRKQRVSTYLKKAKLGKRVIRGATEFWKDVKHEKELYGKSRKETIKDVKYSEKWFTRRQARLKGVPKARDEMREKWHRINKGEIDEDWWGGVEGEELMEFAGYD